MEAPEVMELLTTVVFVALAVAGVREWVVRRNPATGWFCLSLLILAWVSVLGRILPEQSDNLAVEVITKLDLALLALFPYFLYKLTVTLEPAPRALDLVAAALTVAVIVATVAVPSSELMSEADRAPGFTVFVVLFLLDWTFLSGVVAVRLWRAGRGEPLLARRRMRALALGAIGLSAALLLAPDEELALGTQLLALGSALLFFLSFVAPRALRASFRGHAEERFRSAVAQLMGATTADEVSRALLSNATDVVEARGAVLLDASGEVIGSHGLADGARTTAGGDGQRTAHGASGFADGRDEAPAREAGIEPGPAQRTHGTGEMATGGRAEGGLQRPTVARELDQRGERIELVLAAYTLVVWTSPFTPVFGRSELEVLSSLGQLAELALERTELYERDRQAHDALRRQIDFSRMLVDSTMDGILAFDRNYRYTLWNQGMERITGMPRAETIGRVAFDVFPFLKEIGEDRYFDEALRGRDATSTERRYDMPDRGPQGFFEARYSPLHGQEGDVVGGLAIVSEVTDRKRAEEERERRQREEVARAAAEARSRMIEHLQTVTDAALGHLSVDDMVAELLDRITEMLGMDMAALALLDEDDQVLEIRAATGFEKVAPQGSKIPVGSGFLGRVAEERQPVSVEELTAAHTHTPALIDEGIRSVLGVPLIVSGRLIGAIAVGRRETHRFSPEDTGWMQLAADRVALAVEQASVYEREHGIAETLQRSLLPESLPDVPYMRLAARYLAGGAGAVGGDWYDAIQLPQGRVGLAMGDVVGHGIGAASLMGQMRSALRAYALEDAEPASVLRRLDRLIQSTGPTGMATLLFLILEPGQPAVSAASAGHPPPLVREPDRSVRFLPGEPSVPLGVQGSARFETRRFPLTPGSALVLYTDGLIERRGGTLDEGFERLEQVVASGPDEPDALCDHILREILPDDPADDTALLVVQLVSTPTERLRLRPPADPNALASVRHSMRRWLGQVGLGEQELYDVLVASGEACANAIEHAYGPGDASFEVDAWVENGELSVSVRDFGQWRAPRGRERGRGLKLMEELMDSAEVESDPEGTTVRLARALGSEVTA